MRGANNCKCSCGHNCDKNSTFLVHSVKSVSPGLKLGICPQGRWLRLPVLLFPASFGGVKSNSWNPHSFRDQSASSPIGLGRAGLRYQCVLHTLARAPTSSPHPRAVTLSFSFSPLNERLSTAWSGTYGCPQPTTVATAPAPIPPSPLTLSSGGMHYTYSSEYPQAWIESKWPCGWYELTIYIYIYNYIYIYTCIFGEPGESKQFIQIRLTTFYYVLNDSDKHPR